MGKIGVRVSWPTVRRLHNILGIHLGPHQADFLRSGLYASFAEFLPLRGMSNLAKAVNSK